jgi:hypothetical protein
MALAYRSSPDPSVSRFPDRIKPLSKCRVETWFEPHSRWLATRLGSGFEGRSPVNFPRPCARPPQLWARKARPRLLG